MEERSAQDGSPAGLSVICKTVVELTVSDTIMKSFAGKTSRRTSGFSLLEMTIVLALIIVMASVSFLSLQPVMRQQRITNSYNTVLSAMRQGRDNSVAQRTSYSVTLNSAVTPNTITVAPTFPGPQGIQNPVTYALSADVGFIAVSGIPTAANKTPDGLEPGLRQSISDTRVQEPA